MEPPPKFKGYGGTLALRALCNATKALLIEDAVRHSTSPLLSVLDLGVGRGGDLTKWKQQRVFAYLGLDLDTEALETATRRHQELLATGRSSMRNVIFKQWDLRCAGWPVGIGAFDVVCVHLVLPYLCESCETLRCFVSEVSRATKPGAQVLFMFPDPARVRHVLTSEPPRFYHIKLEALKAPEAEGCGQQYAFSLPSGTPVVEFVVPLEYLQKLLEEAGFRVGPLRSAQEWVSQSSEDFLSPFMQGLAVTQKDWHSLGFFATLWAQKAGEVSS